MSERSRIPPGRLAAAGLNRQHVFDLAALPAEITATLGTTAGFRQLILLGHGGKRLWECVQAAGHTGGDPIDDYCARVVADWFAAELPGRRYRIVHPGSTPVPLQYLGTLAGWHHPTPFMVGIDPEWGTWNAYRAVVLADTGFSPSRPVDRSNPCTGCQARPCIPACPAGAMDGGSFALATCIAYRQRDHSRCQHTCLARIACPVGSKHRYGDEQMRHAYSISLDTIRCCR
ncbi:MAG: hypothetical protein HZT41_17985 [Dechloromonas sp.]|nr:MAG: hypothetical protein HZT41_17985 [Dechloromonas sp.]